MNPFASTFAALLAAAAAGLAADKANLQADLVPVNASAVSDVENFIKSEDAKAPALVQLAVTEAISVLGPDAEPVMASGEGDLIDKAVALLNAAAVKLKAA